MSEQLKPCPFCGGDAYSYAETKSCWCVGCRTCNAEVVEPGDMNAAISAWNRRSVLAATPSEDGGEVPDELDLLLDWFEGLLHSYDWLGTGSDQAFADREKAEAWEKWERLCELVESQEDQHSRIVAAKDWEISTITAWWRAANVRALELEEKVSKKDAEIARLREAHDDMCQKAAFHAEREDALRAQPARQVGEYGDAYQGAREDLAIWKRRALEAEESVRRKDQIIDHLTLEAQGETRMGEPVIPNALQVGGDDLLDRAARNLEIFNNRPRSMCRDCADYSGVCQNTGLDCDITGLIKELRTALAPAAVVMPDKHTKHQERARPFSSGWNAALDEVARLNSRAILVELLERIAKHLEWDGDPEKTAYTYAQQSDALAVELRALLGKDGER